MTVILAVFAVTGVGLVAFGARLGRRAFLLAAVPMMTAAAWVAAHVGEVTGGAPVTERTGWVGGLGLSLDLRLDGLAATMSLIVATVGVAVLVYASHYFAAGASDLGRLAGVTAVAVASGPDGEFIFNVTHRPDVSFRDAIPTMPGFAARVVASGDGAVSVTAHDPEAEG